MHVLDANTHSLLAETSQDKKLFANALMLIVIYLQSAHTCVSTWSVHRMHAVCGNPVGNRSIMLCSGQQDSIRDKQQLHCHRASTVMQD